MPAVHCGHDGLHSERHLRPVQREHTRDNPPNDRPPIDEVFVRLFNGKDLPGWVNVNTGPRTDAQLADRVREYLYS